jgi:hypothetical protein
MRVRFLRVVTVVLCLLAATTLSAQQSSSTGPAVPRLVRVTGMFAPATHMPPAPVETVTLAIYADETGGTPLWQETQYVAVDPEGRYSVLLGVTQPDGLPMELFASGDARWLGRRFERPGEHEQRRVLLASVPYALKASDADTLGGRPASAYLLADPGANSVEGGTTAGATTTAGKTGTPSGTTVQSLTAGATNYVAKFTNATDLGNSAIYDAGGMVGVNTATPADFMHVRFTDTSGAFTGYAVQNLGSGAASYSGTLFYDQNGVLGQFQGFNNSTHEYRINNIAKNGSNVADGSINFMTNSTSRFFVASSGNVGIGTTNPQASLEVSNALNSGVPGNVIATNYTNGPGSTAFIGRKSRGTSSAPTPVQSGDSLAAFLARGYSGAAGFGLGGGGMILRAGENWNDTSMGTSLDLRTTANGTTTPASRLLITPAGNVGIGTANAAGALEVVRSGSDSDIVATSFGGQPGLLLQAARGTSLAPTAVQLGDTLGYVAGNGYGATVWSDGNAAMGMAAAENWTDTAHGTAMGFFTTPLGSTTTALQMAVLPNGNVGIGTPQDVDGMPTATDKLQVFGDARVGTSATNGCLKNFAGTGLVGTCSSDRRFKQNITPFGPVLQQLTALQPVHYFWRAAEFPDRHFGNSQAYGLIAQDVEQVLPELVVTGDDGYKAVDYSKLPLLTIEAVKELKAENDALKVQNDALKERVAEIERLIRELRATSTNQ